MTPGRRGALAAAAALATVEAAALLSAGVPSAVGAVADVVLALLPGRLTTWLLGILRGAGRPTTLAAVGAAVLLVGSRLGRIATERAGLARLGVAVTVTVGGLAQLLRPGATAAAVVAGAVGAGAVGSLLLPRPARASTAPAAPGDGPARAPSEANGTHGTSGTDDAGRADASNGAVALDRRRFLGAVLAGGATVGLGTLLGRGGRAAGPGPSALALPPVADPLPAVTAAQDLAPRVAGLSPILTPVEEFYRIDTALSLPRLDVADWTLTVRGRVEREVTLTFDELVALGLVETDATIACVSNEVGGGLVGTARWTGVPLDRVLALAGPRGDAEQLVGRSADGWTAGFPLDVLTDGRAAMVAVAMNGEPLPVRHGFPARLIVPGLYGYVSATKWLTDLELTGWDAFDAYWVPRGWAKEAPIKTASRVDVPREDAEVPAGRVAIAGVAWAPTRGVASVEVSLDDGPWRAVDRSAPLSDDTWVQWVVDVTVEPGEHEVRVRAVDGDGTLQPEGPKGVLPDGAEGWHVRRFRAR